VPAPLLALDFNTSTSPTAAGFTGVKLTKYTPTNHLGWQAISGLGAANRAITNALTRDFHWGRDATFLADVPNGTYDLVVGLGDASVKRDRVYVWAEGSLLASEVTTPLNQFMQVRGRVTVADGKLNLRIADLGGATPYFALDSLVLTATDPGARSLWGPDQRPAVASSTDASAVELGVRFQSTASGYIAGIRFYKGSTNTGTHTGSLWSADGTRLATATFTNETTTGWQEVRFDTPVAIAANTTYVASYFAPRGGYAVDANYFALSGVSSGRLTVLPTRLGGGGTLVYGGGFPNQTNQSSNYWVDVIYAPESVPPTVTSVTPPDGATDVALSTSVKIAFSEAIDAATINGNTVQLKTAAGATVAGAVTYDPATWTATFTPSAALADTSVYTVVVKGSTGTDVVRDLAGNALAADFTSIFTTASSNTPPTADAGSNQTANEGSSVSFSGIAGGGPGTLTYHWDFGDGGTSDGTLTPSHTYADNGSYTVTLSVTLGSQTASDTATVTVNNVAPTGTISNNGPVNVDATVTISFSNQNDVSSADQVAGYRYSYDFNNDGTWDQTDVTSATATTTFSTVGSKTVKGRIKDKDGGSTVYTTVVDVNGPPTANAGADKTANEGSSVSFTGTAGGGPGTLTYHWDFGDGGTSDGTLTPSHTYADNGTYTVTLSVTLGSQTASDTATVTVNNVAPTASLSNSGPVNPNATVTISFANQNDVSSADRAAGYRYSYDFNNDGTWEQTDVTSATATTTFSSAGSKTVKARITDKDGGSTIYTTTVIVNNPGDETYNGLTVPHAHGRLWFTPDRLARARQYYATHPFTPRTDDPQGNALRFLMTGETSYAQVAINALMSFTISDSELAGTASNTYRWNDWVPVVYDWLYDQLTTAQRSTFMTRYNGYVDILRQKGWGGDGFEANNFYWGYLRNEFNWAVATFYENPMAKTFLDHALNTRWRDSFLPWAAGNGAGGVPQEGTQYGAYMLGYMNVPLVSAGLMGRDLLTETNFYEEAAAYLLYSTSPGPVYGESTSAFRQLFPFNDDEQSHGFPTANNSDYVDFMAIIAQRFDGLPLGRYARAWLANVGQPSWLVAATDPGGTAGALTELPFDYYAPGPGYMYSRNGWSTTSSSVNLQLGQMTTGGHSHLDAGSFQMLRGDRWLTKESTGYTGNITGYNGTGSAWVGSPIGQNGLLFNGRGQVDSYADGPPVVTRVESRPEYMFASENLIDAYRTLKNPYDTSDNPFVKSAVRDFIYVRDLDTLIVFDRTEASGEQIPAASVPKTFLLHFPNNPVVSGNTVVGTAGNQALKLTALTPAGQAAPTFRVVNELSGTPVSTIDYQYRLEESTSGQAQSYLINVMQARAATGADVTATMTETATTFTITLTHPTLGTAVIELAKGMISTGGKVGYSATGTPTNLQPLRAGVEGVQVAPDGIFWEGSGPPVLQFGNATVRASEGTNALITVRRHGDASVPVTVQYATSDGTATAGSDYTSASGTLSFAAGEIAKTFLVSLKSDSLSEGDETVNLTLSNPTGGASLGTPATAVLTIANAAPQDTESPTATVTSPSDNANVTGTITLTATATDNVGVVGVRFYVDGVAIGAEDTTDPYSVTWDSSMVANGTHVITAKARDAAGNIGTSSGVTVTTSNTNTRLVAAFGFNEGTGTTVNSTVGGMTGTISGATWTTGKYGGALSFDGVNDWVTVADSAGLDLTTGMTLEAWVQPSAINSWETVMLKEDGSELAYALYGDNNGNDTGGPRRPGAWIHEGSTSYSTIGNSQLVVGQWAHLAATYDGSSLRLYVNGVLASTTSVAGSINVSSGVLRIGGNNVWGEFFNGLIDEVRIYSRALSQTEIQTDMTTPV